MSDVNVNIKSENGDLTIENGGVISGTYKGKWFTVGFDVMIELFLKHSKELVEVSYTLKDKNHP